MARSEMGLDVWRLAHLDREREFQRLGSAPEIMLPREWDRLLVKAGRRVLVLKRSSFEVERVVELPENLVRFEMLPSGDLNLVLQNEKFDEKKLKLQRTIKNLLEKKLKNLNKGKEEQVVTEEMNNSKIVQLANIDISDEDSEDMINYNVYTTTNPDADTKNSTKPTSREQLSTLGGTSEADKDRAQMETNQSKDVAKVKPETDYKQLVSQKEVADKKKEKSGRPVLMRRGENGLEMEESDPQKFQFQVEKMVLSEYSAEDPGQCRYLIFQCYDEVLGMHTESVRTRQLQKSKKAGKKNKGEDDDDQLDLEQDDGDRLFETVFVLANQTSVKVRYLARESTAPFKKIFIEKPFNFSSLSDTKQSVQSLSFWGSIWSQRQLKNSSKYLTALPFEVTNPRLYGVHQHISSGWVFLAFGAVRKDNREPYVILIAKPSHGKVIRAQVNMSQEMRFDSAGEMRMELMRVPLQGSESASENCFGFFLEGQGMLGLVTFKVDEAQFGGFKFMPRPGISEVNLEFSRKRKLFFVPSKNVIQVFDDQLQFLLDSIETEKNIERVVINDDKDSLLVYDLYFYYEIDLDRLVIRRRLPATNSTKDRFFLPLNLQLLPSGVPWRGVFYHIGRKTIRSVSMSETLELTSFPFETFRRCFDPKSYSGPVKLYAQYYFDKLSLSRRSDYEFGPVSPLNMCIFHENSSLLEEVFDDYYYPVRTQGYVSPLEYAFLVNHKASINELCQALLRRDEPISFSRSDFKFLLSSELNICHRVISTMISDPGIPCIPRLAHMDKEMVARSSDFLVSMAIQMRREDLDKDRRAKRRLPKPETLTGLKKYEMSNNDQISKREISVSAAPFKFNYSTGTDDSVMLVNRFANSKTDEFTLSDWRQIVLTKWARIKPAYVFFFLLYVAFLTVASLSLVFMKASSALRFATVGCSLGFLFYELLRLLTYLTYKPAL